jgi:hypothetical protein
MSKAPAALGPGEARTWPCGCRAPLGQRGANPSLGANHGAHSDGTRKHEVGRTDKKSRRRPHAH